MRGEGAYPPAGLVAVGASFRRVGVGERAERRREGRSVRAGGGEGEQCRGRGGFSASFHPRLSRWLRRGTAGGTALRAVQ